MIFSTSCSGDFLCFAAELGSLLFCVGGVCERRAAMLDNLGGLRGFLASLRRICHGLDTIGDQMALPPHHAAGYVGTRGGHHIPEPIGDVAELLKKGLP